MKITLLRHAPTAGNLRSNYIGRTDEPLAPEGVALAKSVGPDERVTTVHTSSLARARQTAGILFPGAEQLPVADLDEMDFGDFEGKNWKELEQDPRYAAWLETQCEAPCPGGESKVTFSNRCRAAFLDIVGKASADIHLVAHGGVIMAVMSGFVRPGREYFDWKTGYCEGYVVETDGTGEFRLLEELRVPRDGGCR